MAVVGRHGIPQTGHRPERAAREAADAAARHVGIVRRLRAFHRPPFKGDWWWLAGFSLGFISGGLLLYAGFLLWLTGSLTEVIRDLLPPY